MSKVEFEEGTHKKGGMNPPPDPSYVPPKPPSFSVKEKSLEFKYMGNHNPRDIIDATMRGEMRNMRILMSMENLARDFTSENIEFLRVLRSMGHVPLADAAEKLGFGSVETFVMHIINMGGINMYVDFTPVDGKPGIRVPFDKISIDLGI